jgi:hypothetical protein
MGEAYSKEVMRNAYKILDRKFEGKGPFWGLRHKWEDNIEIQLTEKVYEDVDWVHVAQDLTH